MRALVRAAALLAAFLPAGLPAAPRADPGDPAPAAATGGPPAEKARPSFFSHLWHLDDEDRAGRHAVTFHRSNYLLVFTYNETPNQVPWAAASPPQELLRPEAAFQLSFKAKVWQDVLSAPVDLWVAYTQRSFWQVYHVDESSPFRETDYEPEAVLNVRTRLTLLGLTMRFVQVGIDHQSNGQREPLSRSWNRVVAGVGVERGRLSLAVKAWYRLPERAADDDNPAIERYLGYGELWGYYCWNRHRVAVMVRDNLEGGGNRGAVQLEWSFPLFGPTWPTPAQFGGYVQWYLGYGESLLDYDHRVNRIGAGFILAEWY
jgi:phospholipase A1